MMTYKNDDIQLFLLKIILDSKIFSQPSWFAKERGKIKLISFDSAFNENLYSTQSR